LKRHADWLDSLPESQRQEIRDTPEPKARLHKVKKAREQQWLAHQPKAVREYLAKLGKPPASPATDAAATVGALFVAGVGHAVVGARTAVVHQTDWREQVIAHFKYEAAKRRFDWQIASNFWDELT